MQKKKRGRPEKAEDESLSSTILLRVHDSEKTSYADAAKAEGMTRSQWMRLILNRAAKSARKD